MNDVDDKSGARGREPDASLAGRPAGTRVDRAVDIPRPRQGYIRQRPWRWVRVEGVAANGDQRNGTKGWLAAITPEPRANASRQLQLPTTPCTERVAPCTRLMYEGTRHRAKGFLCKTSADPWLRGSRGWPAGSVVPASSKRLWRIALPLIGRPRCRIGSASDCRTVITSTGRLPARPLPLY